MTTLRTASVEELVAELARRNAGPEAPPPRREAISFAPLITLIEEGVAYLAKEGCYPKDFDHYVYEKALECVYGPSYWAWSNRRLG